MKQTLRMIFFENKLLPQPDVVFDSESNSRYFSSPAPPGDEKKLFSLFFLQNDVTSRQKWKYFFSSPGGARELNYDHSTQNRKLHQVVVTVCFRKKSP